MSAVRRHRLTVAYDGRPFAGWQSQAGGNTVQDILLAALQSICSEIETVQGSGRTDSGVSADAQIAHFDVPKEWRMNSDEWRKALNANLPPAIRIFDCDVVDADFHARFSAEGKRYGYCIETGEALPPLLAGLAWHRRGLDLGDAFVSAAALFEGTHDFRAFSANRNDGKDAERDTVRTISRADVKEQAIIPRSFDSREMDFFIKWFVSSSGRLYIASKVDLLLRRLRCCCKAASITRHLSALPQTA